MKLGRSKIKYTIGQGGNPEYLLFSFHGKHWSLFFPDLKGILEKGLKPCHWEKKSEGEMTYSIATDEFWNNLECADGNVLVHDNSYGITLTIKKTNELLLQRVRRTLEASGRFQLEDESQGKTTQGAPNQAL